MRHRRRAGMTLVELLIVTAIMGILAVASAGLLSASLGAQEQAGSRLALQREGLLAMERMTDAARRCTFLLVPNSGDHANTTRQTLAVSGFTNDDGDYYFGDPLFPRIDEDLGADMNSDGFSGIRGFNDDGDNQTDEWSSYYFGGDDDEDSWEGEDPINGLDDDGDGNVDEDCHWDSNWDLAPGIAGIDDDGDGLVDEGHQGDDDEDGSLGEAGLHPIMFQFKPEENKLFEKNTATGAQVDLSTNVQSFQVEYLGPELITITLVLSDGAEALTFVENVCIRNALQRTGKRVR